MSYLDKVKGERLTETMNANWNHHNHIIKKLLLFTGQWPYQRPITRLFRVILISLSTICVLTLEVIFNSQ